MHKYSEQPAEIELSSQKDLLGIESSEEVPAADDDDDNKVARATDLLQTIRVVGPARLVALLFFLGYGGSYGVEGAISCGPPLYVLLSFLIAPFVWSLPEALITAEMSSSLPNQGGNILWAKRAFGDFLAWQSGFWAILSIPSAVSIFPVMFVSFLEQVTHVSFGLLHRAIIHFGMVSVISAVNITGIKNVSGGNIVFSILVLSPFFLLILTGLFKDVVSLPVMTDTRWNSEIDWKRLATTAIWSCGGYTNMGQLAGEIHNPRRSFIVAIFAVILMTLFFSLLPLSIAICINPTQEAWHAFKVGQWAHVAKEVGGDWLMFILACGGMISALGEMNSSFCAQSRLLNFLSSNEDFIFPKVFAPINARFRTPHVAIVFLGCVSFVVSLLPFQAIMSFVVFLASISLIITFLCAVKLRQKEPHLERPFIIPLGKFGLGYATVIGISVSMFNLVIAPWTTQVTGVVMVILGVLLFFLAQYVKKNAFWQQVYRKLPT